MKASLLVFLSVISFVTARRLCDVRIWYLNLIRDDVFHTELNQDQLLLKQSIEMLVRNAGESKEKRMKECAVLQMYSEMLKEHFGYVDTGIELSVKDDESDDSMQINENEKLKNKKQTDVYTPDKNTEVENKNETEANEQHTDSYEDIQVGKDDELDEKPDIQDNEKQQIFHSNSDSNSGRYTESDVRNNVQLENENLVEYAFKDPISEAFRVKTEQLKQHMLEDKVDGYEDEFDNYPEQMLTNENLEGDSGGVFTEETNNGVYFDSRIISTSNENHFDETELFDESYSDLEDHSDENSINLPNLSNLHDQVQRHDRGSLKSIPIGICWSFGCIVSDIFYVCNIENGTNMDELHTKQTKDQDENKNDISPNVKESRNASRPKKRKSCSKEKACFVKWFYMYVLPNSVCIHNYEDKNHKIEQNTSKSLSSLFPIKMLNKQKKAEDMNVTNAFDDVLANLDYDSAVEKGPTKSEYMHSETLEQSNTNRETRQNQPNGVPSAASLSEFEDIIEQKTFKYQSQIQSLEVMVMKLENKLLTEALNKQNHSSTITKLENHILKLENELLKISKHYEHLKVEADNLRNTHNKYLELAYKQQAKQQYLELPDHSAKNFELISQHQAKLNELTSVLRNQSNIIMELKGKQKYIEEQNVMLHQMVMNQSILMTSIIKTVQDLSEQNIQNQKEIDSLRRKLDSKTLHQLQAVNKELLTSTSNSESSVIDDLDTLVFNNKWEKQNTPKASLAEKLSSQSRNYLSFKTSYLTSWCPKEKDTCSACYYYTVSKASCVPYRSITWSMCSTNLKSEENSPKVKEVPPVLKMKDGNLYFDEASDELDNKGASVELKSETAEENVISKDTDEENSQSEDELKYNQYVHKMVEFNKVMVKMDSAVNNAEQSSDEGIPLNENHAAGHIQHKERDEEVQVNQLGEEKLINKENGLPEQKNANMFVENDKGKKLEITKEVKNATKISQVDNDKQNFNKKKNSETSEFNDRKDALGQVSEVFSAIKDPESNQTNINTEKSKELKQDTKQELKQEDTKQEPQQGYTKQQVDRKQELKQDTKQEPRQEESKQELKHEQEDTKQELKQEGTKQQDTNQELKQEGTKQQDTNQELKQKNAKQELKQEDTKQELKQEDTKQELKPEDTKQELKQEDTKQELKQEDTKQELKQEDTKQELKQEDTKQEVKQEDTKQELKHEYTKQGLKQEDTNQELKQEDTKQGLKQDGTKQEVKQEDTRQELKQEDTKLNNVKINNDEVKQPPSSHESQAVEKSKTDENFKAKPDDLREKETPRKRAVPINLGKASQTEPKDCYDYYSRGERRDGLYKVRLAGSARPIELFCDMRRGGWTLIQRRQDGTTNFFQTWDEYKKGFGGLYGEHWLGNDNIHLLTNQDYYKLRVDLMDWDKKKKHAEFDRFLVESEDEGYRLHVEGYAGDAGDGLTKHDGNKFSTKDVDNDKVVKEFGGSCAKRFSGAGWYYKCYSSNLNGKYYKGGQIPEKRFDGVTWKPWTGPNYSLKKVEMKIRPSSAKG